MKQRWFLRGREEELEWAETGTVTEQACAKKNRKEDPWVQRSGVLGVSGITPPPPFSCIVSDHRLQMEQPFTFIF